MLDHEIENLTNKIAEKFEGITKNQTPILQQAYKDLIKEGIEDFFKNQIAVIWTVEDVQTVAQQVGIVCDNEIANNVLDAILGEMDAYVGINWSVIEEELRNQVL